MEQENQKKDPSRLVAVLREGISVVQMILFKELKSRLVAENPNQDKVQLAMIAGAVTNSVFGVVNPEEKFQKFNNQNRGIIEQEQLALAENFPGLTPLLTDALRSQTLCDHQEEIESPDILKPAADLGILIIDREVPLPSTFIATVRTVGAMHNLIIAPAEIDEEEEKSLIQ
ncbi:MAG: hypothetical protein ABFS19_09940 [Thermodesulfobacteriota bacterium]